MEEYLIRYHFIDLFIQIKKIIDAKLQEDLPENNRQRYLDSSKYIGIFIDNLIGENNENHNS